MKRFFCIVICLLSIFSVFSLSYEEIITDINQNRASRIPSKNEEAVFKSLLNNIEKNKGVVTEDEVRNLLTEKGKKKSITVSEALEDIDLLFRDIKYAYNGYLIYGGDKTFSEKQKELENEIKTYKKNIPVTTFTDLTYECLSSFITDFHFQFGDKGNLSKLRYCYFYSNEYFEKDSKGFYKTENGKILYVDSLPDDVTIQYTLLEDGSFCYSAVCFALTDDSVLRNITYKSKNGQKKVETVKFTNKSITDMSDMDKVKLVQKDNVAYLYVRSFENYDEHDPFRKTTEACKNADILIIDLRGNQGGSGCYEQWMDEVFGAKPNASRASALNQCPFGQNNYGAEYGKEKQIIERIVRGSVMDDDKLVFLLTDDNCASGGDMFANFLSFKQNTLQIGSNTMGCVSFGGFHNKQYLPNSGVQFEFGPFFSSLRLGKIKEGQGVMPDVLCDTSIALEATFNMLVRENIVDSKTAEYIQNKIKGVFAGEKAEFEYIENGNVVEMRTTLTPDRPIAYFDYSDFKPGTKYRFEMSTGITSGDVFMDCSIDYGGHWGGDVNGGKIKYFVAGYVQNTSGYVKTSNEDFEPFEVVLRFVPDGSKKNNGFSASFECKKGETRPILEIINNDLSSIVYVRSEGYEGDYAHWKDNPFK